MKLLSEECTDILDLIDKVLAEVELAAVNGPSDPSIPFRTKEATDAVLAILS